MFCLQIAEVLIDNGAKINMQDAVNFTPLHIACNFGNEKVCHRTFKSVKKIQASQYIELIETEVFLNFYTFIGVCEMVVPFTGGEFVGVPQG